MAEIPRAQDQLFDRRTSARGEIRGAGRRPARVGRAHQARSSSRCCRRACRARSGSCCARRCIRRCSALRPQRRLRPERRAASSAQNPHRRQRRHRRQLPDRRQGRRRNRGITIGSGVFIGRNTILSCKNGDIDIERRREHRLQLRDLFREPRARRARHADRRVLLSHRRRSRLQRSVAAGPRAGRGGRPASTVGAGAWLGAGAKILDGVTIGDRAVVGAGAVVRESVPAGAIAVGIPAKVSASATRPGMARRRSGAGAPSEAERAAGLRSPRLGRIAHARREAAVRVDDSAVRSPSATTCRWSACGRRICQRKRWNRSASTSPTCTSRSSIRRRCRRS